MEIEYFAPIKEYLFNTRKDRGGVDLTPHVIFSAIYFLEKG